jgi:hypothetical protein
MKSKGDRSKRLENIEQEIEIFLRKQNKQMTTNQIKVKIKIKISWITLNKYLEEMAAKEDSKIIKTVIGKFIFWEIKKE